MNASRDVDTVNLRPALLILALAIVFMLGVVIGTQFFGSRTPIHGVERVRIVEGAIEFVARVDTGAAISSINARDIRIVDGDGGDIRKHIGRQVQFTLVNAAGQTAALQSTVIDVKSVRTGDCREWRYHIYLTVEFRGVRTRTLVNLNDRSAAGEKMLLGREWLRRGYLVDTAASTER